MRFVPLLLLLLLTCERAYCQKDLGVIIPSAGLSYQEHLMGEVAAMYGPGQSFGMCGVNKEVYYAGKLGSEFNFDFNHFMLAPKASFECDVVFVGARVGIVDYTNFSKSDPRATLEAGITIGGLVDIFYGWNIPISSSRIPDVSKHRLTLNINFVRDK